MHGVATCQYAAVFLAVRGQMRLLACPCARCRRQCCKADAQRLSAIPREAHSVRSFCAFHVDAVQVAGFLSEFAPRAVPGVFIFRVGPCFGSLGGQGRPRPPHQGVNM